MFERDYHFHKCEDCQTIWKHSDVDFLRPPNAHNCPNCGREEYYCYRVDSSAMRPVYCSLDIRNGFILPVRKSIMTNGQVYVPRIDEVIEIANGPLEGCRAKICRKVTGMYFQATLIDSMEPWEVGERVSLGPGCYLPLGTTIGKDRDKAVLKTTHQGPTPIKGKSLLNKGKDVGHAGTD
jgi:hypothetical protein